MAHCAAHADTVPHAHATADAHADRDGIAHPNAHPDAAGSPTRARDGGKLMPGLWRNQDGTRQGKYLVLRRDGTVPEAPVFVLLASDPAAAATLRNYAGWCRLIGMDAEYVADLLALADEFETWHQAHHTGDPTAPRHRTDNPSTVAMMKLGG